MDCGALADLPPGAGFDVIQGELAKFARTLGRKPRIVVATKIEDDESERHADELDAHLKKLRRVKSFRISAVTGRGSPNSWRSWPAEPRGARRPVETCSHGARESPARSRFEPILDEAGAPRPPGSAMLVFDELLTLMVREGGSDLILKTGGFPAVRVHGLIRYLSDERIDPNFAESVLAQVLDERGRANFEREAQADCAF